MRDITKKMFERLNDEESSPIDLLDIQPVGANETFHVTNAGESVTWNGNTYYPFNMTRGASQEVAATNTGSEPAFSISIQNVDLQMAAILNRVDLDGAKCSLWIADRRLLSRARDAAMLTQGEARDFQMSESVVGFNILNAIGILEQLTVPRRIHQALCNYAFGSQACTVDRSVSPYTVAATALTGSTDQQVVVSGTILALAGDADPTDFWDAGDIIMASGGNVLQTRPIQTVNGTLNTFYVRYPFAVDTTGASCYIRRGCNKTKTACQTLQVSGSADNFGGFEEVPYGTIAPVTVNRPTGL